MKTKIEWVHANYGYYKKTALVA